VSVVLRASQAVSNVVRVSRSTRRAVSLDFLCKGKGYSCSVRGTVNDLVENLPIGYRTCSPFIRTLLRTKRFQALRTG
jgi:hypothetical protein